MFSKAVFRCAFRIIVKNMGDPYYEPTIVVHDEISIELSVFSDYLIDIYRILNRGIGVVYSIV